MASYTWNAVTGGDWNTDADWTPNGTPGAADNAIFANNGYSYTVTGDASAASITVNADEVSFTGALAIDGSKGLVGTNNAYVDIASTALVTDSGGVNFASGTLLEVDGLLVSGGGAADVALVTGTGAGWSASAPLSVNQLYVAQGAVFAGDLTLNDGGTVNLDTSAGFGGNTLTLAGNGTVYIADAVGAATGTYALSEAVNVAAGQIFSLATDPGVSASVSGGIAGAGSVAVTSGEVTFAAPNTYTGGTNVLDATLTLAGAGAAGTGAIFLDNGALILAADSTGAAGSETVVGAGGNDVVDDTVSALSGSLLVFGSPSGTLTFTGGANTASVVGGAGILNATGGSGADAIYGGSSGQDLLFTGTGPTTLASAYGGTLSAVGGASNVLVAAGGNTTLAGASSTGNNVYFTSGTGSSVVQAGSGVSTVVAGGAVNTIYGAAGTQDVFLSGGGVTQLDFVSGSAGGTSDILGFSASDSINLTGYAAGTAEAALASETVAGGNTILNLSDDTHIVLFGFTGVTAATFT